MCVYKYISQQNLSMTVPKDQDDKTEKCCKCCKCCPPCLLLSVYCIILCPYYHCYHIEVEENLVFKKMCSRFG